MSTSEPRPQPGSFDSDKADELAGEFVANGTWNCPTLIRVRAQQLCDSPDFATDPDLRYLSAKLLHPWTAVAADFTSRFSAEERDTFAAQFEMQLQLVAIFDRVGVPMLAGTDAVGAVWVIPGSSLHREFDLLGRAGLTPLRVLQTATVRPAEFLGLETSAERSPPVDVPIWCCWTPTRCRTSRTCTPSPAWFVPELSTRQRISPRSRTRPRPTVCVDRGAPARDGTFCPRSRPMLVPHRRRRLPAGRGTRCGRMGRVTTSGNEEPGQRLRCAIVLSTTEDECTAYVEGRRIVVPYAPPFPRPRTERVLPGHLIAIVGDPPVDRMVVWRWFDAIVLDAADGIVRMWEPSHGAVDAEPRDPQRAYCPGSRAYLSAGLPGAPWWVAGPIVDRAEEADVEFDEVWRFISGD